MGGKWVLASPGSACQEISAVEFLSKFTSAEIARKLGNNKVESPVNSPLFNMPFTPRSRHTYRVGQGDSRKGRRPSARVAKRQCRNPLQDLADRGNFDNQIASGFRKAQRLRSLPDPETTPPMAARLQHQSRGRNRMRSTQCAGRKKSGGDCKR